ncbi:MAG: hypothetical protein H0T60_02510 [Acidobacteria bacterium]|nr:hypothetical protein [Acidobacteriota bacterium]
MFLSEVEDFRTLYVDPGEDTGWCLSSGNILISAGTTKLWPFADDVWAELESPGGIAGLNDPSLFRDTCGLDAADELSKPINRVVCEDFRIYPWVARNGDLDWDQVRTARLIGALTFMARLKGIDFFVQGAKIKERAEAGGAQELFYNPLKENRHQNDAIMHYTYFTQIGPDDGSVASRVTYAEAV